MSTDKTITDEDIRRVFIEHGFTVKPYVLETGRALVSLAQAAQQSHPNPAAPQPQAEAVALHPEVQAGMCPSRDCQVLGECAHKAWCVSPVAPSKAAPPAAAEDSSVVRPVVAPFWWVALLDEAQRPHQIRPHLHTVGFRKKASGEEFVASEETFKGWKYTLHPLYLAPQPAPQERRPLTDGRIKDGLGSAIELPTQYEESAFTKGVRFAERAHGITATGSGEAG